MSTIAKLAMVSDVEKKIIEIAGTLVFKPFTLIEYHGEIIYNHNEIAEI